MGMGHFMKTINIYKTYILKQMLLWDSYTHIEWIKVNEIVWYSRNVYLMWIIFSLNVHWSDGEWVT